MKGTYLCADWKKDWLEICINILNIDTLLIEIDIENISKYNCYVIYLLELLGKNWQQDRDITLKP